MTTPNGRRRCRSGCPTDWLGGPPAATRVSAIDSAIRRLVIGSDRRGGCKGGRRHAGPVQANDAVELGGPAKSMRGGRNAEHDLRV